MTNLSFPSPHVSADANPRVHKTVDAVNWDAIASLGCSIHRANSSHWGEQVFGACNLVRFLHLHDSNNTTLIARVPLRHESDDPNVEHYAAISKRISSEVATMEYIEKYTNIPVPHVFLHAARAEESGDVHSPFIIMSHIEGVHLSSVWDEMEDAKRRVILQQVIDILLELWSHRFDKRGVLFKREIRGAEKGKDSWYVDDSFVIEDPAQVQSRHRLSTTSYVHAADYWLAYANAYLRDIREESFGSDTKAYEYFQLWFMRSIIPSLFDPSVDLHGYPLSPGDFHSQNILVTNIETPHPRITGVIDWEFSGTEFPSYYAWYPLFIVDHPAWPDDHPLRKRNIQDQATFDELLLEAEAECSSSSCSCSPLPLHGSVPLSHLIFNSYPIYLFCQIMQFPDTSIVLYPLLFAHIYGDDDAFNTSYYTALMYDGILEKERGLFEMERDVWIEARKVLGDDAAGFQGDDAVGSRLKANEFEDLVLKNLNRFDEEGSLVRQWLALRDNK